MNEVYEMGGERAPPREEHPVSSEEQKEFYDTKTIFCSKCGSKVRNTDKFCEFCGFSLETVNNGCPNYEKPLGNMSNSTMHQGRSVLGKKSSSDGLEWGPILKGGVLAVVLSALLGFILGFFLFEISIYTFIAMAAIINIISLFIGSLYAGSKAMNNGATHGLMAGVVCVLISQPINLLAGIPISIAAIFGAIIWGMIIGVIGGFVGSKLGKLSSVNQPQATSQTYYS